VVTAVILSLIPDKLPPGEAEAIGFIQVILSLIPDKLPPDRLSLARMKASLEVGGYKFKFF
jgi:hypothetical protein